jgi:hypothetical protein
MKRFAVGAACLAVALVVVTAASAANAPQNAARGSGTVSYNNITDVPLTGCTQVIDLFGTPFCVVFGQVGAIRTTQTVDETFDFNAKLDSKSNLASGKMKLGFHTTSSTDVVSFGNCVPSGGFPCPVPGHVSDGAPQNADASADVTCLNVVQNRASIGGHVTKFSGDFAPTQGMLFNATDNTIAKQQTVPDQFSGAFVSDVPFTCPPPSADYPISSGDIIVDQG